MTQKYEKHGMTRHRAYRIWRNMHQRCSNPDSTSWKNYGARGITVCARWSLFENFWSDMKEGYRDDLELDRKDNEAGYSKDNCAWANHQQQGRNTRVNHLIDHPEWGRITVTEAAERAGIRPKRLFKRISLGWPVERLFDPPAPHYQKLSERYSR